MEQTEKNIYEQLAAPFQQKGADGQMYPAHKWRVGPNNYALPYIDSRMVAARLNNVLGVDGWSSTLVETTGNYMICELTCYINGKEVTKSDVGTPSNIEKEKGQASDALKRAAVQFGIGAYLYEMQPVKINMKNGKPATKEGRILQPDELTSYINQMAPKRMKLSEIYNELTEEQKSELSENFKAIWNAISTK
jgi:hypothetical protein